MQNSKVPGIMHRMGLKKNRKKGETGARLQFVCGNQGWKYLADTLKIKTKAEQGGRKKIRIYIKN